MTRVATEGCGGVCRIGEEVGEEEEFAEMAEVGEKVGVAGCDGVNSGSCRDTGNSRRVGSSGGTSPGTKIGGCEETRDGSLSEIDVPKSFAKVTAWWSEPFWCLAYRCASLFERRPIRRTQRGCLYELEVVSSRCGVEHVQKLQCQTGGGGEGSVCGQTASRKAKDCWGWRR